MKTNPPPRSSNKTWAIRKKSMLLNIIHFALNICLLSLSAPTPGQARHVTIKIDPDTQFQQLDGLGISINTGWWHNGSWEDAAVTQPAIDWLIDSLGASLFRAVIEDMDWEAVNDDTDPMHFNMACYNEIFANKRFEGVWKTLRYLNTRGIDGNRLILSFMGAPPTAPVHEPADPKKSWMGGTDYSIHPAMEDEFVETIAAFLYYARHTAGIRFYLVAPVNETEQVHDARNNEHPQGVLEGPNIPDAGQLTRIIRKLILRLDLLGMNDIRMVAPDAATTRLFRDCVETMSKDSLIQARLAAWGIHQYGNSTEENESILAASGQQDASLWVTEMAGIDNLFSQFNGKGRAFFFWDGFDCVYQHARRNNYGDVMPNDWVFWEGEEGKPLMEFQPETATWTPRPQFRQFEKVFRSIKPGSVRIGCETHDTSLLVAAFKNPDHRVVLTGMNTGIDTLQLTIPLLKQELVLAPGQIFILYDR